MGVLAEQQEKQAAQRSGTPEGKNDGHLSQVPQVSSEWEIATLIDFINSKTPGL